MPHSTSHAEEKPPMRKTEWYRISPAWATACRVSRSGFDVDVFGLEILNHLRLKFIKRRRERCMVGYRRIEIIPHELVDISQVGRPCPGVGHVGVGENGVNHLITEESVR